MKGGRLNSEAAFFILKSELYFAFSCLRRLERAEIIEKRTILCILMKIEVFCRNLQPKAN